MARQMDLNFVFLIGRTTKDVRLSKKNGKKSFCFFDLAVNLPEDDKVVFVKCRAFDRTAEVIAGYSKKGQQMAINGFLDKNTYNGMEYLTVTVRTVQFLQRPKDLPPELPPSNNTIDIKTDREYYKDMPEEDKVSSYVSNEEPNFYKSDEVVDIGEDELPF